MAEWEKDHYNPRTKYNGKYVYVFAKQNCPPEKETSILLLEERMVDPKDESDEFVRLLEESAELDRGSESVLSQEISPDQQTQLKTLKKQYNTLKEHSTVRETKLQAKVDEAKEQITKLDQQRQELEQKNQDLQRRLDINDNEMKSMQEELIETQNQLSEKRHKNSALETKMDEMQKQLQEKGDQVSEMRQRNTKLEGKLEEMQNQLQQKGDITLKIIVEKDKIIGEKDKIIGEKDKDIKEYHEKLFHLHTLQTKTAAQLEVTGEQNKALKDAQVTLSRENDSLVKGNRKWLNLCEKIKGGNPTGEDTEIDKQIELLTSATPLIKPEIAVAYRGKDSIAENSGQTSDGTPSLEDPSSVKIKLVEGDIVQETADVKVVATTSDFDLSKGAVRALLNAGGKTLEDDCNKQYRSRRDDLIIVVNGEESVKCREMYLARLRPWDERDISDIPKAMATSLKLANAQRHNSILFAAIGTGPLNYPKDKVAIEMYQAVIDFIEKHTVTLKNIGFVIYDPDTTSAFKAEERFRKIHAKPAYVCDIGQIKFQIVIGNILEQRANAIIYEVDSDFKDRQREFERDGLTIMKNSGLPTRMLICVTFEGVPLRWRQILGCLEKANKEERHTVSCSLHGEEQTRSTVSDTEEITSSLLTAVEEFSQKYKDSNIKCINYVLAECDEDKLTAVVELLQSMILRAEKRKRKEKGQIVGILLSQNVK